MRNHYLILLFGCLCCSTLLSAQDIVEQDSMVVVARDSSSNEIAPQANLFRDMPYVHLHHDKYVERFVRSRVLHVPMEAKAQEGFRVQVLNDNDPQQARARAEKLSAELRAAITEPIYVVYSSPFWKVRIGDFKNIDAAKEYKAHIVELFPDLKTETYIVKDKIQVLL